MEGFFIATSVLFLGMVAPLWLVLHYRYKGKMLKGAGETKSEDLDELLNSVDRLTDRIDSLERILDQTHQDWRSSVRSVSRGGQ